MRASASRATCRPEVLAARKKTLSMPAPGAALSSGNSVPTVLPMPVGACASKQRPATAVRYTASDRGRWPARKPPANGKAKVRSAASRAARWATSCAAQSMKRPHSASKCACSACAVHSSDSTVSFWVPISRYTSDTVSPGRPREAHSSHPYTRACAQWSARWAAGWRSSRPLKVLTSSTRPAAASKPSARPRTRSRPHTPSSGTSAS